MAHPITHSSVVLITGASSGLGLATANRFAAAGCRVIGTARTATTPIPELDDRVDVVTLDVSEPSSVAAVVDQVLDRHGRVDVLVNNAGYFHMGPAESSTIDEVRAQFNVNVFGLVDLSRQVIPHMRRQGAGAIINISSISAVNGFPFIGAYGASKAAVLSFTETWNIELAPFGVTAKAILPGTHATSIFSRTDVADPIDQAYHHGMRTFFGNQSSVSGSSPDVVADLVWEAVTDGNDDRVRYYAGPDARMIPRAVRMMGERRYFRFLKKTANEGPGPIMRRLSPQGDQEAPQSEAINAIIEPGG